MTAFSLENLEAGGVFFVIILNGKDLVVTFVGFDGKNTMEIIIV